MSNAKVAGAKLEELRAAVALLDTEENRERYRRREFPRAEMVQDLDKRFRYDVFYAVWGVGKPLPYSWADDLNDSHINTALKAVIAPLGAS